MRAVIEERIKGGARCMCSFVPLLDTRAQQHIFSANVLYFGCRSASKDQHYDTEWCAYADSGSLDYRPAFSRDVPEGEKRTYVQDIIKADAKKIWKLVGEQKAWVLISGYERGY